MKVTIEFDSVSDRDMLDEVLRVLPNGSRYKPPTYITAPPPATPLPPVDLMAVPTADDYVPPEVSEYAPTTAFAAPLVDTRHLAVASRLAHVEFDADGLPWDGRIHSSSKALLVDGKWRQRRNTDPAVVAAVTAELRAALGAPAPAGAPPAPADAFAAPFGEGGHVPLPAIDPYPAGITASIPVPPPALAVVPPPPPVDTAMTFPEFMKAITAARIPPGTVLDACKAVGMPSIPALNQRPDLIPTVATELGVA